MFEESTCPIAALRRLARHMEDLGAVHSAAFVYDDPAGPTVEVTLHRHVRGLPPVVASYADAHAAGARVRRVEPRGAGLPLRVLIR